MLRLRSVSRAFVGTGIALGLIVALAVPATALPGDRVWVRNDNVGGIPWKSALSPDGTKVFVTGQHDIGTGPDYVTRAYNTSTGAQLWAARYDGPGSILDVASSLVVSPDGSKVFVSGTSSHTPSYFPSGYDMATIAYNATTGSQLWIQRYNGPADGADETIAIAMNSKGSRLFVTGRSEGGEETGLDIVTISYDAATGNPQWTTRFSGRSGNYADAPSALVVKGSRVFVLGAIADASHTNALATLAYNAGTGAQLWVRRSAGAGPNAGAQPLSIRLSPDGSRVFMVGSVTGSLSDWDIDTVAVNTATGAQLWHRRYRGPVPNSQCEANYLFCEDEPTGMVVSPQGSKVYVSGWSYSAAHGVDYVTLAYNAATGGTLWSRRESSAGNNLDVPSGMALDSSGSKLVVTGYRYAGDDEEWVTVQYNTADGTRTWRRILSPESGCCTRPAAVVVTPKSVYVSGSAGGTSGRDVYTVAYNKNSGTTQWNARYAGPKKSGGQVMNMLLTGSTLIVVAYTSHMSTVAYSTV